MLSTLQRPEAPDSNLLQIWFRDIRYQLVAGHDITWKSRPLRAQLAANSAPLEYADTPGLAQPRVVAEDSER